MFTAALFTIAKIRKQPKYPPISEWGKKLVYTYTHARAHNGISFSHKKLHLAICNNMDKSRGYYAKKSGKYHMTSYMESRRAGCGVVG